MFCTNCGVELTNSSAKFCVSCGASIRNHDVFVKKRISNSKPVKEMNPALLIPAGIALFYALKILIRSLS